MKRVLVDMDNVTADFDGSAFSALKQRHPELAIRERQNFLFAATYPDYQQDINEIIHTKGFYENLPLMPGTIEAWEKMAAAKYEPVICSSPLVSNEYCIEEKFSWLRKHLVPIFGQKVLRLAEITINKYEVEGVALIDDKPTIKNSDIAIWEQVIYDQPYNRGRSTPYRLHTWYDPNLISMLDTITGDK